jgi:hypothetical protein
MLYAHLCTDTMCGIAELTAVSHLHCASRCLITALYINIGDSIVGINSSAPSALWFEGLLVSIEGDAYTVDLEDSQVYTKKIYSI